MDASSAWSPPPMVRTASAEGVVLLRHPTPDLQSLQGAYVRNVERLEESAERLSEGGSDLADEIRKAHGEQKLSDSRRSSMRSQQAVEGGGATAPTIPVTNRSRNTSTSSWSNSIVDVNGAARWGGYSPGGYVTSPIGSARSGSWSHASAHLARSTSRTSRLTQVPEPEQDGRPTDTISTGSVLLPTTFPPEPPCQESQSILTHHYVHMARDDRDQLESMPFTQTSDTAQLHGEQHCDVDALRDQSEGLDTPDRPPTAASADMYHIGTIFNGFDGVHHSPTAEDNTDFEPESPQSRRATAIRNALHARPQTWLEPPPGDNMVYYPAPVPRMLNLPKRLSQLPSAAVQARRRTQLLASLPPDARNSAAWLPGAGAANDEVAEPAPGHDATSKRMSATSQQNAQGLVGLPPQLRANLFFEYPSMPQEVRVTSESAVDTLDSILEASATAPVSAFTDHPFAGHVGHEIYGRANTARRYTTAPMQTDQDETIRSKKRGNRRSLSGFLRRAGSTDELNKLEKKNNRLSIGTEMSGMDRPKKLQKRNSKMSLATDLGHNKNGSKLSLGTELDDQYAPVATGEHQYVEDDYEGHDDQDEDPETSSIRRGIARDDDYRSLNHNDENFDEEGYGDAAQEDPLPGEQPLEYSGVPTTLLAELQLRKQHQKLRNRAATSFPNGMHSTLLEMDAVAQIEKKRRERQRVALAWEDPGYRAAEAAAAYDDDDVPLGRLFPVRTGLINKRTGGDDDWDKPLGLIERRELEDNEPLSSRRNRLSGLPPGWRGPSPSKGLHLAGQPDLPAAANEDEEDEEETLAQRIRRLKNKEALNSAIGDVTDTDRAAFSDDVLSQFGGLNVDDKEGMPTVAGATDEEPEEETLGQRKKRLQAQAAAQSQAQPGARNLDGGAAAAATADADAEELPPRPSSSMANLLSANPVGSKPASKEYRAAEGTLLHASERQQAKNRRHILEQNKRSSSFGLDRPLVGVRHSSQGNTAAQNGGFAGGLLNAGFTGPITSMSTPMTAGNGGGYFAPRLQQQPPQANGTNYTYGLPQPQVNMNPMAYQGLPGFGPPLMNGDYVAQMRYAQQYGYLQPGYFPMQMPMAMQTEAPMPQGQRELIDRWRSSIAP